MIYVLVFTANTYGQDKKDEFKRNFFTEKLTFNIGFNVLKNEVTGLKDFEISNTGSDISPIGNLRFLVPMSDIEQYYVGGLVLGSSFLISKKANLFVDFNVKPNRNSIKYFASDIGLKYNAISNSKISFGIGLAWRYIKLESNSVEMRISDTSDDIFLNPEPENLPPIIFEENSYRIDQKWNLKTHGQSINSCVFLNYQFLKNIGLETSLSYLLPIIEESKFYYNDIEVTSREGLYYYQTDKIFSATPKLSLPRFSAKVSLVYSFK